MTREEEADNVYSTSGMIRLDNRHAVGGMIIGWDGGEDDRKGDRRQGRRTEMESLEIVEREAKEQLVGEGNRSIQQRQGGVSAEARG